MNISIDSSKLVKIFCKINIIYWMSIKLHSLGQRAWKFNTIRFVINSYNRSWWILNIYKHNFFYKYFKIVVSREIRRLMVAWKLLRKSAIWWTKWLGCCDVLGWMSWLGKSVVVAWAYDFLGRVFILEVEITLVNFTLKGTCFRLLWVGIDFLRWWTAWINLNTGHVFCNWPGFHRNFTTT